jgi:ankyrin repeat protein
MKDRGQNCNETTAKNGWSGLHLAAEKGRVGAVEFLLANGVDKNMRTTNGALKGFTAKQIAERKGQLEVVKLL